MASDQVFSGGPARIRTKNQRIMRKNHRSTKHVIPGQYIFNSIQYRLIQAISQRFAHNLPMANVTRLDIVALLG